MGVFYTTIFVSFFCTSLSAPQQPEISDQFSEPIQTSVMPIPEIQEPVQLVDTETEKPVDKPIVVTTTENNDKLNYTRRQVAVPQVSFSFRIYKFISDPIIRIVNKPKVNAVLRNIGTCVVNGAMELFSYYLPAPLMPLLASAAGLVIPFEPVIMLKEKMPVTSYRRAFQTAMRSFLSTFDKYKLEDDFDPYMTRRFNRRFITDDRDKKKDKIENLSAE